MLNYDLKSSHLKPKVIKFEKRMVICYSHGVVPRRVVAMVEIKDSPIANCEPLILQILLKILSHLSYEYFIF